MSAFSKDALETISSWSEILTAAFGILAAASAVVYLLANRPLRKIEAHESQLERQATARAQKEAAEAQLALSQTLTVFASRLGDRVLDVGKFVGELKDKPKKIVEIWYKPDDIEAERFSDDIRRALQSIGWPVSARELKPDDRLGGMSVANQQGILVLSRHIEDGSPFSMLILKGLLFGGGAAATTTGELPENKLVIVVGTRNR